MVAPSFVTTVRPRSRYLSLLRPYHREAEFKTTEQYICSIQGREVIRTAYYVYKQSLYSGILDELRPEQTPTDFFSVNTEVYPLMQDIEFQTFELKPGNCVFIPAFSWV